MLSLPPPPVLSHDKDLCISRESAGTDLDEADQLKPRRENVMAHDASQLLGAQQMAGALVNRRGHGWQHAARATGGLAGVAMGYAAAQRTSRHTTQTPAFSRTAFVAVTDREVALIKYGPGSRNGKAGEV